LLITLVEVEHLGMSKDGIYQKQSMQQSDPAFCNECRRLLDRFADAVRDVISLNESHLHAVSEKDPDPHRFDLLIHEANEKKQNAKYAYVTHLDTHSCSS